MKSIALPSPIDRVVGECHEHLLNAAGLTPGTCKVWTFYVRRFLTAPGVWTFSSPVLRPMRPGEAPSPGGRFENSPAFQGWVQVGKISSPVGTAERTERPQGSGRSVIKCTGPWSAQYGPEVAGKGPRPQPYQPSLRDAGFAHLRPSLERLGYSQVSLRERFKIKRPYRHVQREKYVQTPAAVSHRPVQAQ